MAEAPVGSAMPSPGHVEPFDLFLDLIQSVNRGTSREQVFLRVAEALRQIFEIDRFATVLVQGDGSLEIVTSLGLSPRYLSAVGREIDHGVGVRALAQRKPIYIPDVLDDPLGWPLQDAARDEGFHTVLVLPLFAGTDPLGYLIMYHDRVRMYTAPEVVLAQALAQQATVATQQARLQEAEKRQRHDLEMRFQQRVDEAEAIDSILLRITSSLDLDSTLQSITQAAARMAGQLTASFYLRDPDGIYRPKAAHGIPMESLRRVELTESDGLLSEMCKTGRPAQALDMLQHSNAKPEAREAIQATRARGTLGVPLMEGDRCIGALYVARAEAAPFSEEEVRALQRFAAFAQVAVQNAQRFSTMEAELTQLQAYVDAIPEGIIVFDRAGTVALVNEAFKRELGTRQSLVGASRRDVFDRDTIYGVRPITFRYDPEEVFGRVLSTGKPEQGLLEMHDPNRTYEMHIGPLRMHGGRIDGVVATMRDITVPLELERERSRANLLVQLLDLSTNLNSELSIAALTQRVVEAAMDLLGAREGTLGLIERDKLVFRRFHLEGGWVDFDFSLDPGQGAPGYVWETMEPYVSNDCANDPRVLHNVQQRLHFQRLACVPVMNRSGQMIGTLGVYDPVIERDFGQRDVEVLQLLAHQVSIAIENARLGELKDAFLSIVSHELKTPVTSIKGFTQILQRRLSADVLESSGKYLEVITQQSDRLTDLINDLLDLSRIQTGRFEFDTAPLDYSGLVEDVVSEMELIASDNPIEVTMPPGVQALGNADRLRQVLVNLLDNARKHGPPHSVIRIAVTLGDGEVSTCVSDEGPGLPPGEEERIFSPYYQVRQDSSQYVRGLGLGLFITREIVREHGGRIWVEPGDNTAFCFTLPVPGTGPEKP